MRTYLLAFFYLTVQFSAFISVAQPCADWARGGGGLGYDGFPDGTIADQNGNVYFTGAFNRTPAHFYRRCRTGRKRRNLFLRPLSRNDGYGRNLTYLPKKSDLPRSYRSGRKCILGQAGCKYYRFHRKQSRCHGAFCQWE